MMNNLFITKYNILKSTFLIIVLFSCKSPEIKTVSEQDKQCDDYNYVYNELVQYVNKLSSGEIKESSYQSSIDNIKGKIAELDTINCLIKKDISFAKTMINKLNIDLENQQKQLEELILNGEDWGIQGVKLKSDEIKYDEYMNSYAEVTISNKTNKKLISLKFGVDYCYKYYSELCYVYKVLPITIEPLSSKSFSFDLPHNLESQGGNPRIFLLEVVISDGKKVITTEGIDHNINLQMQAR